jgi:hypothetical protein
MLLRAEQTTEGPMTAPTTSTDETPAVRLEPCAAFRLDHDAAWPACDACGWLENDHTDGGAAGDAVVTVLPRRPASMPQRLAS